VLNSGMDAHSGVMQLDNSILVKTTHSNALWDIWPVMCNIFPNWDDKDIQDIQDCCTPEITELAELFTKSRKAEDPDKAVKTEITEIALTDNNDDYIMTLNEFGLILYAYGILVYLLPYCHK
jgi:hypothetical protein